MSDSGTPKPSFANRLGLHRPELRAWALYDVANSAFYTTVLQIFPLFFVPVAAKYLPPEVARSRYALATSLAVILVGLTGPITGALADVRANKKTFLGVFLAIGVAATAAMYFITEGQWVFALSVFVIGNIGVSATLAFYNSLLPGIASNDEVDRVSTAGFALGYLGGGVLLALNLFMIQSPATFGLSGAGTATRLSFLSVAVWWLLFSIPLFRRVPEPAARLDPGELGEHPIRTSFRRLGHTIADLKKHKDAGLLLLAFLLYNDAINTIIRMATTFGDELKIPQAALIGAVLMVQFVGVPFSFAFGYIADKIGPKKAIFITLAIYAFITIYGYTLQTTAQFFVLAFLVAMVQGGAQALSRSLFATLIPKHKAGEMFGFFGVFDRFGGALGSMVFGVVLGMTGSSRPAILTLIVFFAAGALLLWKVDVERGRKAAREAEALAHDAPPA